MYRLLLGCLVCISSASFAQISTLDENFEKNIPTNQQNK